MIEKIKIEKKNNKFQIENEIFIIMWLKCYKIGGTILDLASDLGCSQRVAIKKAKDIWEKQNIKLPELIKNTRRQRFDIEEYYKIISSVDIELIQKNKEKLRNLIKNKKFIKKILENPRHCFYYCKYIIEGRCVDLEPAFFKDTYEALNYSAYVLNEELPKDLHDFMKNKKLEKDNAAKQYFIYWNKLKKKGLGVWGNYI